MTREEVVQPFQKDRLTDEELRALATFGSSCFDRQIYNELKSYNDSHSSVKGMTYYDILDSTDTI